MINISGAERGSGRGVGANPTVRLLLRKGDLITGRVLADGPKKVL